MDNTHIVTAELLENFSQTNLSEGVIPELIWMLVTNSVNDLTECRIPYGNSIGLPGFDGLVTTDGGYNQFIPKGTSYWEIGTSNNPGKKATSDYKKRTYDEDTRLKKEELAHASYVFLTPVSKTWPFQSQKDWKENRKNDGWKEIKTIDGIVLADWLREFPTIAKWLLKKMGNVDSTIGFLTVAEHWDLIPQSGNAGDPKLPPNLFLLGREQAQEEISKLFRGEIDQLIISIESEQDIEDFVSAYIESLSPELSKEFRDKCLFISTPEAWQTLIQLKSSYILVPSPNLSIDKNSDLHMAAKRHGHKIIIPISGSWANGSENILSLRSPQKSQIEKVLMDNGFSYERANEIANKGKLSTIKRFLRGLGEIPPYATWDNARLLTMLNLIGQFNSNNEADSNVLENLLGKPKGEWIDDATDLSLKQDTPLYHYNGIWKINSRVEAWQVLGSRINKEDLDRFSEIAIQVLSAENPKFSLEKEKIHSANFYGIGLEQSDLIREGIAETITLLGTNSKALVNLNSTSGEYYAANIVRSLLKGADWKRWASLNLYLPMLAEAAPDMFLESVDSLLATDPSPFLNLFALEDSGIFGGNYISGLLWALETLAWSPDHLILATELLGELAAMDPGGTWGNRPKNSLAEIFLPWHYQTTADLDKRLAAIRKLEKISPTVCSQLLSRLLPTPHATASGSRKPLWRQYETRSNANGINHGEYEDQINAYFDYAIKLAKTDFELLTSLVTKFAYLPLEKAHILLEYLGSPEIQNLSYEQRNSLWNSVTSLTTNHRKHIEQSWAMSLELIERIENTLPLIIDNAYLLSAKRLFTTDDFSKQEFDEEYNETFPQIELRRISKASSLLDIKTVDEVIEFAKSCQSPFKVGYALGALRRNYLDSKFISEHPLDEVTTNINNGYIAGRFWFKEPDWDWADSTIANFKTDDSIVNFLIKLSFNQQAWMRVGKLNEDAQKLYWKKCDANVWTLQEKDLLFVLEKFSTYKRYFAGVACLYVMTHKGIEIPFNFASDVLLASQIEETEVKTQIDQHYLLSIIKNLQQSVADEDIDKMLLIEWNYLPLLGKLENAHAIFLEQKLADEPQFFCELVALVFKSDKDEAKPPVTEQQKNLVTNAYRLLDDWIKVPGTSIDEEFSGEKFTKWFEEMKILTMDSGHYDIALEKFGQILPYSPPDPGGLWIHRSIAEALDDRKSEHLRNGLNSGFFNRRGVFTFTSGKDEMRLANEYYEKAAALDDDFPRLAQSLRELAKNYESDSIREARKDYF